MNKENYVTFYNGQKMPIVGFGTYGCRADEGGTAVTTALEVGYRHVDTAFVYRSEQLVGNAVKKFLEKNQNVKRDDIFITTKLPPFAMHKDQVQVYLKKSLENLQLQYVDLYLIHGPIGLQNVKERTIPIGPDGAAMLDLTTNLEDVWKGMEAVYDAGLTKAIGLSNFNIKQIQRILNCARIQPANLQVECHAYFAQTKLFEFCKDRGITFCAYAPIGNPDFNRIIVSQGRPDPKMPILLNDPVVTDLAKRHNKTPAQILLRWLIQRGIVVVPKSVTPSRIKENFDVFDFTLSVAESEELNKLDRNLRFYDLGKSYKTDRHPDYPITWHSANL